MRTRYTVKEPDAPHFITCTVVQWIPLFTRKPYFDILLDALQFCRQHKGLKIYAYVILDNHLHLVVSGPKLADTIRDFKSFTAKRLIAQLEKDEKTWVLNQLQF
ncbi:MAG: transposase [Deltaproteobacteria bacterium]|nr:transposase [Deltaproteobacteria bacterium]